VLECRLTAQAYEVADYEVNIGFDEFKDLYGGGGSVECV
jgi:hypothetical protein